MESSPNLLGFCILILLVCNVNRCESISCSCKQHERNALLNFQKAHMPDEASSNRLESWIGDDCCTWEGVGCSHLTCHVVSLNLGVDTYVNEVLHPATMNDILTSTLTQLRNLEYLDLSGNQLSRRSDDTPKEFNGKVMMNQLRYLYLSNTGLEGQIPQQLGNLTNLQVLYLFNTYLYDHTGFRWVFGLRKLRSLGINGVNLSLLPTNSILELHRLSTLQELQLSNCQLSQDQFLQFLSNSSFLSTSSLKVLTLNSNYLESPIPHTLSNLSSLLILSLGGNNFNSTIPSFLGSMRSLQQLDLRSNKFSSVEGGILGFIEGLCGLKYLDLSNNSLQESLTSHPLNFSRCSKYDLELLELSSNHISGGIEWLENFSSLKYFSLLHNSFSGNFPESIIRLSLLKYLYLSDNNFTGIIPSTLGQLSSLQDLDLSNNKLTGLLPDHIDRHWPSLVFLNLAYNHLNGKIPISLCNFQHMTIVNMKSNRFSGQIPDCSSRNITVDWEMVDLSSNSLSGRVPSFLWELPQIYLLNLSNNTLEGELPVTISQSLQILDLGENDFYGKIPSWHLSSVTYRNDNLRILRLRSNHLVGMVPLQMCSFDKLQIIDLANNHLTGPIPKCFGNLSGMRSADGYRENLFNFTSFMSSVEAIKGIEQEYTTNLKLLVNLDLSRNNFSGSIPVQLTELQGLIGLNVSHNQLTGKIPSQIGKMKSMESLDLSDNNLQGTIPQGLDDLTSLSSLNLSYNKLYGPIPTGSTQLSTFIDPSIYAGNMNLCGDMLPKKCSTDHEKNPTKMALDEDHNGNDPYEKLWFPSFVVLGIVIGFWGVIGILNLKQGWKYAYLKLGEEVADWIHARWMVKKLK